MLSFADLQNDSDDDKGPVMNNDLVSDTQEFLLKQDASVQ